MSWKIASWKLSGQHCLCGICLVVLAMIMSFASEEIVIVKAKRAIVPEGVYTYTEPDEYFSETDEHETKDASVYNPIVNNAK